MLQISAKRKANYSNNEFAEVYNKRGFVVINSLFNVIFVNVSLIMKAEMDKIVSLSEGDSTVELQKYLSSLSNDKVSLLMLTELSSFYIYNFFLCTVTA